MNPAERASNLGPLRALLDPPHGLFSQAGPHSQPPSPVKGPPAAQQPGSVQPPAGDSLGLVSSSTSEAATQSGAEPASQLSASGVLPAARPQHRRGHAAGWAPCGRMDTRSHLTANPTLKTDVFCADVLVFTIVLPVTALDVCQLLLHSSGRRLCGRGACGSCGGTERPHGRSAGRGARGGDPNDCLGIRRTAGSPFTAATWEARTRLRCSVGGVCSGSDKIRFGRQSSRRGAWVAAGTSFAPRGPGDGIVGWNSGHCRGIIRGAGHRCWPRVADR